MLELLYTLEPIWTNLLTQCTSVPDPVFCCFLFQVFRPFKVLIKFWEKYIKNQRDGTFRSNQERKGGPPPGSQEGCWRGPTPGRTGDPPDCLVGPLDTPLRLYLALGVETLNIDSFPRTRLCTAAAVSRSGLPGEAALAPCREKPWTPPGCVVSSPPWTMGP